MGTFTRGRPGFISVRGHRNCLRSESFSATSFDAFALGFLGLLDARRGVGGVGGVAGVAVACILHVVGNIQSGAADAKARSGTSGP